MAKTIAESNEALVLEAFDTLFNKRDYKAAERYWSSNYIQHSAHIPARARRPVQSNKEHTGDTKVRARRNRCRRRLRDRPWPIFGNWNGEKLDRRRYCPCDRWCACGTLGCSAGRSNRSRVAKRSADVRDQISGLREASLLRQFTRPLVAAWTGSNRRCRWRHVASLGVARPARNDRH
jgi:hypothetical protein